MDELLNLCISLNIPVGRAAPAADEHGALEDDLAVARKFKDAKGRS